MSTKQHTKACPVCGNAVIGRSHKRFCSKSCQAKASYRAHPATPRSKVAGKCLVCGNAFLGIAGQKYCSIACRYEANKKPHTCLYCGGEFLTNSAKSRYCSKECAGLATEPISVNRQYDRKCLICKRAFVGPKRQLYCSPKCLPRPYGSRWRAERGPWLAKHPLCFMCGKPATGIHHTKRHYGDPVIFWDKTVWEAVCSGCHHTLTGKGL